METPRKKHKSDKIKHKVKSPEGKKKRKRDHGEGDDLGRRKSKKHRTDKHAAAPSRDLPTSPPFHLQTASLYLPLAPISQRHPLEGMCAEHLSPLILTFYPPLGGVILSYSNARMSQQPYGDDGPVVLLRCVDEFAAGFAWVTAEFLVFKPRRGAWLEGHVNLQSEGHLGLVCWNLFNASVERRRLPSDWSWVDAHAGGDVDDVTAPASAGEDSRNTDDGAGHYVDGVGTRVEGLVRFRVTNVESSHNRERGFVSIEGTMLDEDEERKLLEQDFSQQKRGRRLGGSRALGATSLGIPVDGPILRDS